MAANKAMEPGNLGFIALDVLELIVSKLDAFTLARLYCSGSSSLIHALQYAVKGVFVSLKRRGGPYERFKEFRWSSCFFLRFPFLKSLYLDLGPEYCITGIDWKCLPSSIETINLICANAWTILYDSCPPRFWFEANRREYPCDNTEVLDIASCFPHLNTLVLHGWQRDSCNPLVNDKIIKNLPPTITILEPPSYVHFTDVGVFHLPRNIQSLVIKGFPRLSEVGLTNLPPSLIRLHIDHNLFADHFTKGLSDTLSTLSLRSSKLTEACVPLLPKSLTWLSIDYHVSDWTSQSHHYFPQNLTYLKCWRTINLKDEDVKFLPRKLETLILHEAMSLSDDGINDLPQTLKHLDVNMARLLSDRCIPKLPRELKSLAFHWTDKVTGESAHQLPPSLTYLALPECQYFDDQHIQHLPRSITSLSLRRATLTLRCRQSLPPNLQHLTVADPKLSSQFKLNQRERDETVPVCSLQ